MVILWAVEHASRARELGFESRVKQASQFEKSQTTVSTTKRYFTLSVICLLVECIEDSVKVTKKNIQIVVGRLGWKWVERSVFQLLLLIQEEVKLLLFYVTYKAS